MLDCVEAGTTTVRRSSRQLYPDLVDELIPMAEGTVWAHLLKLKAEGKRVGKSLGGRWSAA